MFSDASVLQMMQCKMSTCVIVDESKDRKEIIVESPRRKDDDDEDDHRERRRKKKSDKKDNQSDSIYNFLDGKGKSKTIS